MGRYHHVSLTKRQRWTLLATVSIGLLLITLDNSILYTALPLLTEELGANGSQTLWIINAYPVVIVGLLLGAGTLGDRVGHRRMFLIGLVIFGVASAAAAFSPSPAWLIASRAVIAVGAAAMMPATLAPIRLSFDVERERNFAIAVWGTVSVVGSAIGPIVGGLLLEHFWWGSVFLIGIPFVVIALIATVVVAPPNDPDPSKHWDAISSLQAMVGLVGAVFLLKELANVPPNWTVVVLGAVAAGLGLTSFVRRQQRSNDPLLDFAIFRNRAFSAGVLAAAISMFAVSGAQLMTTQRFQLVEGFTPLEAGLLVTVVAIGSLPTSLLGGLYLDRVGLLPLIAGGLAVSAIGTAVMIFGIEDHLFWLMVAGLLISGIGLGAVMSVASTAIVGNVSARRAGMASSVEEVSYEFGSLIAVAVLGSMLNFIYSATVRLPPGTPAVARSSLTEAIGVAQGDQAIVGAANAAFDNGFLVTMIVLTVVLALGAAATARLLLHYGPGSRSQEFSDNH
ncbi:Major facilitator superfamily transporter [Propionibacterium freudenreichii]|nr:MFS transporter [Propionibacterium freudenreichii]MCT2983601.1 MFS transporter [Propionibacterium freudenreichii]MCT2986350.1 MFS transporter [Propionibacterium freudenreichii]MDK9674827.1 MFS transporter [Propionibacterium freudenreichii]CEI46332.1 Major facilitator superfamily transporter [Propionibacterium freudenreichii]